jgi:hypothetical protein
LLIHGLRQGRVLRPLVERKSALLAGGAGGIARRSAMNWSNSALSLANRSRSRKAPNSFCSSSKRRMVSTRYSSNARLPDVGADWSDDPLAQFFQLPHGPAPRQSCA